MELAAAADDWAGHAIDHGCGAVGQGCGSAVASAKADPVLFEEEAGGSPGGSFALYQSIRMARLPPWIGQGAVA